MEIYEFLTRDSSGDIKSEGEHYRFVKSMDGISETLCIKTLEGYMKASEGDYIIRGVAGEYCACKPDIFSETYEVAE